MDLLIKNARVLQRSQKGEYSVCKNDVYINNGKIAAVGACADLSEPKKIIEGEGKLAIPGLINCHTHAYMTCLRGIADDLPFTEWLFDRIMPNEDKLTNEDAYYSSLLGCYEMLSSGTTAFLEMHMFPGAVARAAKRAGIRGVISRGLAGTLNDEDGGGNRRINESLNEMEEFSGQQLLSFAFAPHAIYTTDTDYLKYVSDLARKRDIPLHVHLSESVTEFDDCVLKYGCTPVEYLEKTGVFENRVIAAHCANVTDNDIRILADRRVNVVLNIRSNMKLGNGIPPVGKMFDAGVRLCLGTDSAASNNSLNLFNELAAVSLIPKGTERSSVRITASQALDMATLNGAAALGLDSGEITAGKNADIVLLDLNRSAFIPDNDLVSALCYSANGSETDTVIVGGRIVMENGKHVDLDICAIAERIREINNKLKGN